jgi:hypothetical protein
MANIYRKTAKGHSEIDTRALRLPPRLRSALILIDGRRSDDELRKLILQQPDESLHALREHGLIEVIGITHDAPAARVQAGATAPPATAVRAAAAPSPAPSPAPFPAPSAAAATAAPARSFEAARADAVRAFTDLVGPMAEALAIKMERTRSYDELRPLVQTAQTVIGNSRGGQAAAGYVSKVYGSARG